MISYLSGKITKIYFDSEATISLDIAGKGFVWLDVFVPKQIVENKKVGQKLNIYVYTSIKENAIELYGFESEKQKELFLKLISVATVGPKIALKILELAEPEKIKQAIENADVDFIKSAKGVGAKLAKRIVLELKDKIADDSTDKYDQIIDSLSRMGYKKTYVKSIFTELIKTGKISPELGEKEIIKIALKELAKPL